VFRPYETGDWKVAKTRRLESLRYIINVNAPAEMSLVISTPTRAAVLVLVY
jgi:hypothetical protein